MDLTKEQWKENLCVIRGGGDIATGIIYKLFQCGFPLLVLETDNPSCIRRTISFCEAVFDDNVEVEGVRARKIFSLEEAYACYCRNEVPVTVDAEASTIKTASPAVVVDAILAKRNLGTSITDAPVVVGVGPGFTAGKDVHAVIETKRGHNLGRRDLYGNGGAKHRRSRDDRRLRKRARHPCAGFRNTSHRKADWRGSHKRRRDRPGRRYPGAGDDLRHNPGDAPGRIPAQKGLKMADIDPRIAGKRELPIIFPTKPAVWQEAYWKQSCTCVSSTADRKSWSHEKKKREKQSSPLPRPLRRSTWSSAVRNNTFRDVSSPFPQPSPQAAALPGRCTRKKKSRCSR